MENRSHALLAGLFTLLLGLAALASVWWFGGQREATRDYVVVTRQNVTGLSPQAQVRYRGIGVGKVQSIQLDPDDVRNILIRIRVGAEVPVTRGTTAKLGYQGVTGIAHVLLEEGGSDATPLSGSDGQPPRIAMQQSLIEELSEVGGATMRQARDLLANANQLLNAENRQRVAQTLSNLEASTGRADASLARLQQLLSPENVRLLNATLARTEQAAGQAGPFFAEARELVARLKSVSEKLDATLGDSPVGGAGALVPRLNELSAELSASSRQFNRVLQRLEDAPQSLIFGNPQPAPGPGEAGFAVPAASANSRGTQ